MESTTASLNSLSLQLTRVICEPNYFRFYQQLTELQTRLNAITLVTYRNYFYHSKPLGSAETCIYAIVPLDDAFISYFLAFYINSLTSKSKKLHSKLLEIKATLIKQLTNIQASITSMLDTYACPIRARLYCNADDSWIYHHYKGHTHEFYKPFDNYIQIVDLIPDKGISTYKIHRENPSFHKDIAAIVWPEDNL